MGKKYNQLRREDRIQIEALYESGMKPVKIAEQLGYHYSTIYREIKRGKTVEEIDLTGRKRKFTAMIKVRLNTKKINVNAEEKE